MISFLLIALAGLDEQALHRHIRQQLTAVRACSAKALADGGSAVRGKLVLRFSIGRQGKVTQAAVVKSPLTSEKLDACVVDAVKAWRFPEPDTDAINVTYPVEL